MVFPGGTPNPRVWEERRMAWEKTRSSCLGVDLISRPGEYEWRMRGHTWTYRFGGGLLKRDGRSIQNLTAPLPQVIRWTQGYEAGHTDGRAES